ncbi:MAG: ABC transporter permease, partial [Chloroflexota bacterium]
GLDLALVVLAAVGIWQLRQYAAPLTRSLQGSLGLDPLLVAAPAIGLLAGALLALRVVPLLAELVESALSRRRGLVGALGSRQLARRPLRYSRSALLLMLAASLAVFAAAYSGTWLQSQQDQADDRVGADLRVEPWSRGQLPEWGRGDAYRRLPGVTAAMGVQRESFDVAGAPGSGQLVALSPDQAAEMVRFRPDLADQPLADLLGRLRAGRPTPVLATMSGEPQRLALDLDVALKSVGDEGFPGTIPTGWPGLGVAVIARDAGGLLHRFVGAPAAFDGGSQRSVVLLTGRLPDGTEVRPAYPLQLVAIELSATVPSDAAAVGAFELRAVSWSAAADGAGWRPLALATQAAQFVRRTSEGTDPVRVVALAAGGKPHVAVARAQPIPGPGRVTYSLQPTALAGLAAAPLPALVSDRFLERTASHVGDTLAVGSLTRRHGIRIVGSVHGFPTADPARPIVVLDAGALAMSAYAADAETSFVGEWWLTVQPARSTAVVRGLSGDPYDSQRVDDRREIARSSVTDPVAVGIIGALSLGAAASLLFATIGFVVSAAAGARERLSEFALLRALGLSPRQLSGFLSLENAFLLAVGVLCGIALGLVLAWLVLPFVTLSSDAAVVNPPLRIIVPWGVIGLLVAIAAAAVVLSGVVLSGVVRRVGLGSTLRLGDE